MPLVIEIDAAELEGIALALEVDKRTMQRAARAAANKAMRWVRMHVARGLSSRLGVPQAAITKRLKERKARGSSSRASVWIGLSALNIARVNPRKTATGLRAGKQEFVGAFVGRGKYGGRVAMRRKGRARYPLEAASLDVLTPGREFIGREAWPGLNERFIELYRAELERRR